MNTYFNGNTLKKCLWAILFGLSTYGFFQIEQKLVWVDLPQHGQNIKIYANQIRDDLQLTFCKAISQAKKSVILIIYSLQDQKILQALSKKAAEGARVQIFCDVGVKNSVLYQLGPHVEIIKIESRRLMHQKILMIDEEQIWIGSSNMTTDSLRMYGNLVVGMVHPEFAKHILQKVNEFSIDAQRKPVPKQAFAVGSQQVEFWFLPDNPQADKQLIHLIHQAKKEIRIAMYTWTHRELALAVVDAFKRGVRVEVVIDAKAGKGAGASIVKLFKQEGIPASLSLPGPMLHHKFAYIDRKILVNGSTNWTKGAFAENDDCFMIIYDLIAEQRAKIEALWDIIVLESEEI
ncbi:phospholipase D-like domain-containing protein [Parachlamydia sp. AcF125]|uniref:phospholipase D-like domain-containing protein n=1 Tax=Parachlamydia sp. AcF125 TaxID=2795736 RepID=UPI001BCA361F|nr:phospholipase D-like domain-containing protein [Parachlamydia sp. AcF125]MBS4168732.1 Cardiolipin synthase B [Parachlamydia sp. AcF125]